MLTRRLGLDLGTNSIGWCLLDLDSHGDPVSIFRTGVRIFSSGRESDGKSLKSVRREAKSARRRRDRFKQRQIKLINELVRSGLMPCDGNERQELAKKDPYDIRKRALDKAVTPFEMGRAIFHINQRRGFKSNRKSGDSEAGVVNQSIIELRDKLADNGARTIGEFLADRHGSLDENNKYKLNTKGNTVRARRLGTGTAALYEFYPNRAMLEQEFDELWKKQVEYDASLYNEEAKERIKEVVFFQRKLKPQEVGRCTFFPEEHRIAKAMPSFQRFRIYQDVHNLMWIDDQGSSHRMTNSYSTTENLFEYMEKNQKITFEKVTSILKRENEDYNPAGYNLQADKKKELLGNQTSAVMRNEKKGIGKSWDTFSLEEQDELIRILLIDEGEDDEVSVTLATTFSLTQSQIDKCLLVKAHLPSGYASLSRKAIDRILEVLAGTGLLYSEAVEQAGLAEKNMDQKGQENRLEYYAKALEGVGMGRQEDERSDKEKRAGKPYTDEQKYGTLSNVTVHIALNQIRAVVNELIRLHGKPDEVVIEVARDLPKSEKQLAENNTYQRKNRANNERISKILTEHRISVNGDNIRRYKLWEELSSDPMSRACPYSGVIIRLSDLFSSRVEVDHILPRSVTLDDSMANKTLCSLEANRYKSNKSPFEAFGSSADGYLWTDIVARSKHLPKSKSWRFWKNAMQRFDEEGGFLASQLNDTRYISKIAKAYLSTCLEGPIWVVTGRLTALLRHKWGLNSVLKGHNSEENAAPKKNRDDHRHHAIDAAVIGLTSRSMVLKAAKAAKRAEDQGLSAAFEGQFDPWPSFREDVKAQIKDIIVSHRPRMKSQGPLHNATALGLVEYNENQASSVVHRVPVSFLTKESRVAKIKDPTIRLALLNETSGMKDKAFEEAVQNWFSNENPRIKSLRIIETVSVVPVADQSGKIYKSYEPGGNAYIEIYADLSTGKWKSEIVTRFDANQKSFVPRWRRENQTARAVMCLRINDLLKLSDDGEIYRVQKMSGSRIFLAPHMEADVDARDKNKDDPLNMKVISAGGLQSREAIKLHISPTGLISEVQ